MASATTSLENETLEQEKLQNSLEFVSLTEVVRQHYVRYLERQLEENVCAWAKKSRNHHKPTAWASIAQSVEAMEARAVKACMAAQVYQRTMIKMIAAVRRNTQECRLADTLFDNMQRQQQYAQTASSAEISKAGRTHDKCTQTEPVHMPSNEVSHKLRVAVDVDDGYANYTLQQKIDFFQSTLTDCSSSGGCVSTRHRRSNRKIRKEPMPVAITTPMAALQSPMSDTKDSVAQELAMLFCDEPTEINAIFGIEPTAVTDDPQLCAILHEIASAELPSAGGAAAPMATNADQDKTEVDLRHSRWPCELYAQRRKLNACLVHVLDADWRCEDELRHKFHLLFGEDSDDEFGIGIHSPSIDLVDEVLLSSCMLRIRPWIVRHLMGPLQEGLIANRFLFKKLAKLLAHSIVLANPYATEPQVKHAVEHLFCIKATGVQSAYDLIELPALELNRDEF